MKKVTYIITVVFAAAQLLPIQYIQADVAIQNDSGTNQRVAVRSYRPDTRETLNPNSEPITAQDSLDQSNPLSQADAHAYPNIAKTWKNIDEIDWSTLVLSKSNPNVYYRWVNTNDGVGDMDVHDSLTFYEIIGNRVLVYEAIKGDEGSYVGVSPIIDVSPNGVAVYGAYIVDQDGLGGWRLPLFVVNLKTGASNAFEYLGGITSIAFDPNKKVAHIEGMNLNDPFFSIPVSFDINLKTLQIIAPPLPEGWVRAASNPNYAFQVEVGYETKTLKIVDLAASGYGIDPYKDLVTLYSGDFSVYDVSRDGVVAVGYQGIDHPPTPGETDQSHLHIGQIGSDSQITEIANLTLKGPLSKIRFEGHALIKLVYKSGIVQWYNIKTKKIVPLNIAGRHPKSKR